MASPDERDIGSGRDILAEHMGPEGSQLFVRIPHGLRLGLKVVHAGPDEATVKLPYRDELVGEPERGIVFGGAITTLLDHACGLAASCSVARTKAVATLDLRIDYLRAAEPGCDLFGHARCYKLTKNVAFVRGTAYERSADEPFASCVATFMLTAMSRESLAAGAARERSSEPT